MDIAPVQCSIGMPGVGVSPVYGEIAGMRISSMYGGGPWEWEFDESEVRAGGYGLDRDQRRKLRGNQIMSRGKKFDVLVSSMCSIYL